MGHVRRLHDGVPGRCPESCVGNRGDVALAATEGEADGDQAGERD
ncbi:hypothetical protein SJ05684_c09050 [Sinorhizobium sojae CCBAU 05684]|uniref:Uncharacterized protein n=1 Tax=Sinorhizobium sojae CCBAU 05684 TaxID=716928 RepID=A0A249P9I2_9HYPH|nr:hypothetical protein SJ05684_c09050 [Sinorhizobium sojae CCBAU 05684]